MHSVCIESATQAICQNGPIKPQATVDCLRTYEVDDTTGFDLSNALETAAAQVGLLVLPRYFNVDELQSKMLVNRGNMHIDFRVFPFEASAIMLTNKTTHCSGITQVCLNECDHRSFGIIIAIMLTNKRYLPQQGRPGP